MGGLFYGTAGRLGHQSSVHDAKSLSSEIMCCEQLGVEVSYTVSNDWSDSSPPSVQRTRPAEIPPPEPVPHVSDGIDFRQRRTEDGTPRTNRPQAT